MARIRKGHWGTLGDLESFHPVGEEGWVASVAGVDYVFTGGRWVDAFDAESGGASLSPDDLKKLDRIDDLASDVALATDWIVNAGADHQAGETLFTADDRRISVAATHVRITYRGANVANCPALSVAELAQWEYVGQSDIPSAYPGAVLAPKGFRYGRSETGQMLELKDNQMLPDEFDLSQWAVVTLSNKSASVHNADATTPIVLKGATNHMAEIHVEGPIDYLIGGGGGGAQPQTVGGKDYKINEIDWEDGQWCRFVQTAGKNTAEKLRFTGFEGVYLRDGCSRDISGGLYIGRRDAAFLITITRNGSQKFLNVIDQSADASAILDYPPPMPPPAPGDPDIIYRASNFVGKLVAIDAGGLLTIANAIAPNALAALYYVDAWADLMTPLFGDGKIFTLPSDLANATIGSDLYLGANGTFSKTPPAITPGSNDLRQPVAVVLRGGNGLIKIRAAAKVA